MKIKQTQKAVGIIAAVLVSAIGITAVASQPDTITALEQSLTANQQAYTSALEACRKTEQALAQAKLDAPGSANLAVEQINNLKSKAAGQNLTVCGF